MRRREKFVLAAIVLSLGLLAVQYVDLEQRYWAVLILSLISYAVAAWALSEDLQRVELSMLVPIPALFAGSVGLFYFLLPANVVTRFTILAVFGIGVYALLLTSNILSVAKGRTIQLLHAAHAIGLFFALIVSLLITNTIFTVHLPYYLVGGLIGLSHFPLVITSLWAVRLTKNIEGIVWKTSILLTLLLMELSMALTFMPITAWFAALFIMSFLYLGVSIIRSFLIERLFTRALAEYALVSLFIIILFIAEFPLK
ncbi:MAG: hypothetical protein COU65_03310 [Candidatus Pacebacteria bacterium CG10_big_fil_rev_8_21_14_0_10_42_12]|nr:hypothetical protein [Candidatus Paceibacterota bacterium]PIR62469.1 MAG: hypothetical protein COU65_03310 [Candidatus Pacebacteria bacterium CG10_big_fil_rev_8_21_14_0_10_42_12]